MGWSEIKDRPQFQNLDSKEQDEIFEDWYKTNIIPEYKKMGLGELECKTLFDYDIALMENGQSARWSAINSIVCGGIDTLTVPDLAVSNTFQVKVASDFASSV